MIFFFKDPVLWPSESIEKGNLWTATEEEWAVRRIKWKQRSTETTDWGLYNSDPWWDKAPSFSMGSFLRFVKVTDRKMGLEDALCCDS